MESNNWSPQQAAGLDLCAAWLKADEHEVPQVFYVAGYAGTGKTTIARALAGDCRSVFVTYTGKAASVLQKKGMPGQTIHSLIYRLEEPDEEYLEGLRKEIVNAKDEKLKASLFENYQNASKPRFTLRPPETLDNIDLIVCDEVSMVGEELGQDLLSFGKKVLVLGDPGQLPPIEGQGYFTSRTPDVMLTEIHRQARGNPIITMAQTVRQGHRLKPGKYGHCEVHPRYKQFTNIMEYQAIVGRNSTRRGLNQIYRDRLGRHAPIPEVGELLICLRNNRESGLLNGTQWRATRVEDAGNYMNLSLMAPEDWDKAVEDADGVDLEWVKGRTKEVTAHHFTTDLRYASNHFRRSHNEFDFGYAITCHKSQGSQWPKVFIQDESWIFKENAARWLYTALTRAENEVQVQL